MPIHRARWRVGETPTPLNTTRLTSEQQFEVMIVRDPRILSSECMLIGRQERINDGEWGACWSLCSLSAPSW